MTTQIDDEVLKDMSVMVLNYIEICRHFNYTEEQMRDINAGKRIIEKIRAYQSAFLVSHANKNNSGTPEK